MPTLTKLDSTFLEMAATIGKLSHARRNQVGCVVVKDGNVIAFGYNGTPSGWHNRCEDDNGASLPEVLHAEANAIAKLARGHSSSEGATLYTTLSPCFECAKLIFQAGITRVVFAEPYRLANGRAMLANLGVEVVYFHGT